MFVERSTLKDISEISYQAKFRLHNYEISFIVPV